MAEQGQSDSDKVYSLLADKPLTKQNIISKYYKIFSLHKFQKKTTYEEYERDLLLNTVSAVLYLLKQEAIKDFVEETKNPVAQEFIYPKSLYIQDLETDFRIIGLGLVDDNNKGEYLKIGYRDYESLEEVEKTLVKSYKEIKSTYWFVNYSCEGAVVELSDSAGFLVWHKNWFNTVGRSDRVFFRLFESLKEAEEFNRNNLIDVLYAAMEWDINLLEGDLLKEAVVAGLFKHKQKGLNLAYELAVEAADRHLKGALVEKNSV